MAVWTIHKFSRSFSRETFDCGNDVLNEWFRKHVGQWEKRGLSRAYVSVREGESKIAGYYAIATHRVRFDVLPEDQAKGLPKLDISVVLLGRLAVDRSYQGQGLGSLLLVDALRRIEAVANQVGVRAVEVDAIDDAARRFYLKFGFTPLRDDERHLFLSIHTIRRLGLMTTPPE